MAQNWHRVSITGENVPHGLLEALHKGGGVEGARELSVTVSVTVPLMAIGEVVDHAPQGTIVRVTPEDKED